MKKSILLGNLVVAFFLAGCMLTVVSADGQLTLGAQEKWNLSIDIVIPSESAQLYGDALIQQIQGSTQELEAEGVLFESKLSDVDEEGNVTLHIHTQGRGYDILNEQLGSTGYIEVQETNGKKILNIELYDIVEGVATQKGSTFTIRGGKVLETNGNRINNTTVEWFNPSTMQVSMEEPSNGNLLGIVSIILGALCILFAIGWQLGWFVKKSIPTPVISVTPASVDLAQASSGRFCGHCGTPLPSQARFCNKCGAQVL